MKKAYVLDKHKNNVHFYVIFSDLKGISLSSVQCFPDRQLYEIAKRVINCFIFIGPKSISSAAENQGILYQIENRPGK